MSPSLRCVVDATDGSNKIITNSKIKNVQLISDYVDYTTTLLDKWENCSFIEWCSRNFRVEAYTYDDFCIRMPYILSTSAQTFKILVPICNFCYTCNTCSNAVLT